MKGATALKLVARAGGRFNRDHVKVYQRELRRIKRKHGRLTTELIVREARPARSPLHECFTWDNTRAAHLYRMKEAGDLCRYILVEVHERNADPEQYAVYYSVPSEGGGREYVTINEAETEQMNGYIIDAARAKLRVWQREYGRVKELSDISRSIGDFLKG